MTILLEKGIRSSEVRLCLWDVSEAISLLEKCTDKLLYEKKKQLKFRLS